VQNRNGILYKGKWPTPPPIPFPTRVVTIGKERFSSFSFFSKISLPSLSCGQFITSLIDGTTADMKVVAFCSSFFPLYSLLPHIAPQGK